MMIMLKQLKSFVANVMHGSRVTPSQHVQIHVSICTIIYAIDLAIKLFYGLWFL